MATRSDSPASRCITLQHGPAYRNRIRDEVLMPRRAGRSPRWRGLAGVRRRELWNSRRAPRQPGSRRPACATRLDQPAEDDPSPGPAVLDAQQRLLALLSPRHPAEDAARTCTDLRVISALLCMSWPLGQDLMEPALAAQVDEHVRSLSGMSRRALDKQPASVLVTAGLLTAAIAVLDSPDLPGPSPGTSRPAPSAAPASPPWRQSWTGTIPRASRSCGRPPSRPSAREARVTVRWRGSRPGTDTTHCPISHHQLRR